MQFVCEKLLFINNILSFKINTMEQISLEHPLNTCMQVHCYVPVFHAELMKQTTSKNTVYFLLIYPPNMHYPAQCMWDMHMSFYLHLSSARFLLHTMIMMMQTMSTITIAPTTIAIIMMRCSLSSFPHQLISTARQNNNHLSATIWE